MVNFLKYVLIVLSYFSLCNTLQNWNPFLAKHNIKSKYETYSEQNDIYAVSKSNSLLNLNLFQKIGINSLIVLVIGFFKFHRDNNLSPFDPQTIVTNGPFFQVQFHLMWRNFITVT